MRNYLNFSFLLAILQLSSAANGSVECLDPEKIIDISLSGSISAADIAPIKNCIALDNTSGITIALHSQGGDVYAAMAIGRLLRAANASVLSENCSSSCVLVAVGATYRGILPGKMGIHRPFPTTTGNIDYKQAQSNFSRLKKDVKEYLSEMNIPEELYDAMIKIPSEDIRYLNEEELLHYGIQGLDPVRADVGNSYQAALIGITKLEYLTRKAEAKKICEASEIDYDRDDWGQQGQDQHDCSRAIIWGLSLRVYKERHQKFRDYCSSELDDEEFDSCKRKFMHSGVEG